jgi:hypothetical protein
MTLSDLLWGDVQSSLTEFSSAVTDAGRMLLDGFAAMRETGRSWGDWIGEKLFGSIPEVGGKLAHTPEGQANARAARGGKDQERENIRGLFAENLMGMVQEMRKGMGAAGGAGGFGGLAEKYKQIQQATFQSTIEQKFLERSAKTIELLERIAGRLDAIDGAVR